MSKKLEQFEQFHRDNPHVYELFKKYTFQVIAKGHKNYSAETVFNRMRWHSDFETTDLEFKLNNNHKPFYSRMFMRDFPQHDGFFRTREQK